MVLDKFTENEQQQVYVEVFTNKFKNISKFLSY